MNLSFGILDYVAGGVLLALFVYQVVFYSVYIAGVPRLLRRQRKLQSAAADPNPQSAKGVSVIICARNEEQNLRDFMHALLVQDYPLYEVIVINDGSQDGTRESIESYMVRDARVKMTFVPGNAHVGSTKKLAITLGAKAAQYDYLLLTDADCRPESPDWISKMVAPFANPDVQIVLGYGAYFEEKSRLNRMIGYDTLFNGLNYLGAALVRQPYMGVGRNLAYRKEFFFETGGFSSLMNYRSGDDDLFVNRFANKQNTAVVACPESITWSLTKPTWGTWIQQKRRHLSVSPHYSASSQFHLGFETVTRGLFYAAVIAIVVMSCLGQLSLWTAGLAALLLVTRLILQISVIDSAAARMKLRKYGLVVMWYDIVLPLIQLYIFLSAPLHRYNTQRW